MAKDRLQALLSSAAEYYGNIDKFIERGGLEIVRGIYGAWLGSRETGEAIIRDIRAIQLEAVLAITRYEDIIFREGNPKEWYRVVLFLLTTNSSLTPIPYDENQRVLDPTRTEVKPGELIEAVTALGRFINFSGPSEQLERASIHVWSEVADTFHNLMQLEKFDIFIEELVLARLSPHKVEIARELITDLRNVSIFKYQRRYVNEDKTVRKERKKDLIADEYEIRNMLQRYDMDYVGLVKEHHALMIEMIFIIRDVLEEMLKNVVRDNPLVESFIVTPDVLQDVLDTGVYGPEEDEHL